MYTTPLLKDLYRYITPQYATQWQVIGTLLGLSSETLDIIEHDNRDKATPCCNAMLKKWLQIDSAASWRKLFDVIELPTIYNAPTNGNYIYTHIHIYTYIHIHT